MAKLMLNTVETGAVTSVTALIYLVVFLLYPEYNIETLYMLSAKYERYPC
jgi:hypothetical protein